MQPDRLSGIFSTPISFSFSPKLDERSNELVYHDGEYHLFYQHNPFGDTWRHMSWCHAVSSDLIRWDQLPVALPGEDGVVIFSGSAVVHTENARGLAS